MRFLFVLFGTIFLGILLFATTCGDSRHEFHFYCHGNNNVVTDCKISGPERANTNAR